MNDSKTKINKYISGRKRTAISTTYAVSLTIVCSKRIRNNNYTLCCRLYIVWRVRIGIDIPMRTNYTIKIMQVYYTITDILRNLII